jgi:hypothetical protein
MRDDEQVGSPRATNMFFTFYLPTDRPLSLFLLGALYSQFISPINQFYMNFLATYTNILPKGVTSIQPNNNKKINKYFIIIKFSSTSIYIY